MPHQLAAVLTHIPFALIRVDNTRYANWTVLIKLDDETSSMTGKTVVCCYTYTQHLPLVSRISSSRFLICEKSCTMASDRSSRRLSSTSRGFSFAASPSYTKYKHLHKLMMHVFWSLWERLSCYLYRIVVCLTSKMYLFVKVMSEMCIVPPTTTSVILYLPCGLPPYECYDCKSWTSTTGETKWVLVLLVTPWGKQKCTSFQIILKLQQPHAGVVKVNKQCTLMFTFSRSVKLLLQLFKYAEQFVTGYIGTMHKTTK
jgi:hypothetical protein